MLTLNETEFARRFYARELRGWVTKDFAVPQGMNAMLLRDEELQHVAGPGAVTVASGVKQLIAEWFDWGRDKDCLVLVRASDFELPYSLSRLLTGDPIFLDLAFRLVARLKPGSGANFLHNLMQDRMSLTFEELKSSLQPEIKDAAQSHLRKKRLQELADTFPDSLKDLETDLELRLNQTLASSGLAFVQLKGLDFYCQAWDERTIALADAFAKVTRKKVDLDTRKQLFELISQEELQAIAEETKKAEHYKLRTQLWERMRRAAQTDKMNELLASHDFEKFLDGIDRDKLLMHAEREEIKRNLSDKLEDRDRARAHLIRITQLKNDYEYRQQDMSLRQRLTAEQQSAEAEIEKGRLRVELERVDIEIQIRRKQEEAELEGAKLRAGIDDIGLGQEGKRKAQQRLDQAETDRQRLETKREEMKQEIDYYKSLGCMPPEALVMAAPTPEKAKLLADLAKLKSQAGMTVEQILASAVAAGSSTQSADILRDMAARANTISQQDMGERRVEEQVKFRAELQKSNDVFFQGYKEMFEKAMKTIADIAQSKGQASPGYYAPFPGYPPYSTPWPAPPPPNPGPQCPRCRQSLPPTGNFCPYCGEKRTP